ncbi:hypothetical protein JVX96_28415 (plasmid) [Variovorax sp. PDNC026]|uniref:hypothetical protein n=1 Tax=Variovorax sp. PDNC026 TaxID=2811425 RepID=UPI000D12D1F2|nr:hypothetical protein [Variovorax sp. PDNC026]AVQ85635.1 hypothetical protein C4F17_32065 [Variovorax sp. PMC12]QRY35265.1 hypothetical protein JVX96_28415 [Variovorax sp. PDNC026]
MDADTTRTFEVGGWRCELEARAVGACFQPVAICRPARGEPVELPQDTEPYATRAEALRHAQQQALRYVRQH